MRGGWAPGDGSGGGGGPPRGCVWGGLSAAFHGRSAALPAGRFVCSAVLLLCRSCCLVVLPLCCLAASLSCCFAVLLFRCHAALMRCCFAFAAHYAVLRSTCNTLNYVVLTAHAGEHIEPLGLYGRTASAVDRSALCDLSVSDPYTAKNSGMPCRPRGDPPAP